MLPLECVPQIIRDHGLTDAHTRPLAGVRRRDDSIRCWRSSPLHAWRWPLVEWTRTGNSIPALAFDLDAPDALEEVQQPARRRPPRAEPGHLANRQRARRRGLHAPPPRLHGRERPADTDGRPRAGVRVAAGAASGTSRGRPRPRSAATPTSSTPFAASPAPTASATSSARPNGSTPWCLTSSSRTPSPAQNWPGSSGASCATASSGSPAAGTNPTSSSASALARSRRYEPSDGRRSLRSRTAACHRRPRRAHPGRPGGRPHYVRDRRGRGRQPSHRCPDPPAPQVMHERPTPLVPFPVRVSGRYLRRL